MDDDKGSPQSYGKMSIWQWIAIYVVIGAVIYGLIYYFFMSQKSGNLYGVTPQNPTITLQQAPSINPTSTPSSSPSASVTSNNIYMVKSDPVKGNYLADFQGITLYIFDKDKAGVSNCYDLCATTWPPYTSGAAAQSTMPKDITVISRTDGTKQFAWKNLPLYHYINDKKTGELKGDGFGGIWHLVKP